jgi:hypothetical protein
MMSRSDAAGFRNAPISLGDAGWTIDRDQMRKSLVVRGRLLKKSSAFFGKIPANVSIVLIRDFIQSGFARHRGQAFRATCTSQVR